MSRFSSFKPLDTCASPIVVWHHGEKFVVPCGKCEPCRLRRANDWSFRLGDELTASPFSIWFTLTYDNKYLPKLRIVDSSYGTVSLERDSLDIRFDTDKDVLREDEFDISDLSCLRSDFERVPIQNYNFDNYLAYASKRDIQLFIKNVRQNLYEYFGQRVSLRYYIISEMGPRTFRPHYHGLFFVEDKEVADYLIETGIYQNWQMQDKSLFDKYVRFTSGGVENYVTDYVTCMSRLPKIYQFKSFRPFRLASKGPAIGYRAFSEKEIYENVKFGIIEFTKSIPSIDKQYIFQYPKDYMARLFPKCYEYGSRSSHSLLSAYRLLYVLSRLSVEGYDYSELFSRFFQNLNPLDFYAARRCKLFCDRYNKLPSYFLELVDKYYSLCELRALSRWYQWQSENMSVRPLSVFRSYQNVGDFISTYFISSNYKQYVFDTFTSPFGLDWTSLKSFKPSDFLVGDDSEVHDMYVQDCEFIVSQMDKSKKLNSQNNINHLSY